MAGATATECGRSVTPSRSAAAVALSGSLRAGRQRAGRREVLRVTGTERGPGMAPGPARALSGSHRSSTEHSDSDSDRPGLRTMTLA